MRTTRIQWALIVILSVGLVVGVITLIVETSPTSVTAHEQSFMDDDVYHDMWRPFVTVQAVHPKADYISNNPLLEDLSASGFLIEGVYERDGKCHIYAVTNYHVIENHVGSITVQSSERTMGTSTETFTAELVRTSPYADLALLRISDLRCGSTPTARLAKSASEVKVLSTVWHSTAASGVPGNHQLIMGQISRYLQKDPFGNTSFSTSVPVVSGESGSAVYRNSFFGGHEVIGIVRSRDEEGATNYVIPVDFLQILIHSE